MEGKERVTNFREYFISLRKYWVLVLAVSLGCGIVLGGYNFAKQKTNNNATDNAATIDEIVKQNHNAYYSSDSAQYTDADTPAHAYNSAARLYIDFDYSDVEGYQNMDFTTLNQAFEGDAMMLVWNEAVLDNVIEKLDLTSSEDMKNITRDRLMWMVNKNFQGAHVMNIVVTDVDPERAYAICSEILDEYVQILPKYMKINEIRVLDEPSREQAEEDSLQEASVSYGRVLKYGIAGFAAGLILMLVILLIRFIAADTVHTAQDLDYAGFSILGVPVSRKKSKDGYKKAALALALRADVRNVLIADVDGKNDPAELVRCVEEVFREEGSGRTVVGAGDVLHSAESLAAVRNADAYVFTASYDRTKVKDLAEARRLFEGAKARRLGVVLVKA